MNFEKFMISVIKDSYRLDSGHFNYPHLLKKVTTSSRRLVNSLELDDLALEEKKEKIVKIITF